MFRFDNYMEQWAIKYKPLSHDPGKHSANQRFYRMDSIFKFEDFVKTLSNGGKSPCVSAVTQIDADLNPKNHKFFGITHRCFFYVKETADNELAAADAKAEASDLAFDFLAWLQHDKKTNKNPQLEALDIGSASIMTQPQRFNGWWAAELVIEQLMQRPLCMKQELYTNTQTITAV